MLGQNNKNSVIILIALLVILIMQLLVGGVIERKKMSLFAQRNNSMIIFNLHNEEVISENLPIKNDSEQKKISIDEKSLAIDKNMPKIAIIIGGLGLSASETNSAIAMPGQFTLGFSPYSASMAKYAEEAIKQNHEVMINLPLEPMDYPDDDPGVLALLNDLSLDENRCRLNFLISQFSDAKGFYSIDDEKYTRAVSNSKNLIKELQKQNKILVFGAYGGNAMLQQISAENGYNLLINDMIIDNDASIEAINSSLKNLEEMAIKNGTVIGYASPYPVSLEILLHWSKNLAGKNIKLVPISEVYNQTLGKSN